MKNPTPHDALFRAAFSDPVRVGGLLRRILPPRFTEQINWGALECVHGVYVDSRLGLHASDLVFRAPLSGYAEESVYFPLEHQSRVHGYMPLRQNDYQVCLGKVLSRGREPGDLPVVLPVLVSHAPHGWKRPLCADDMYMCGLERLGIAEFIPRFTMLHLDLMLASDAELRALGTDPFAIATLWALRESRRGRALVTQLPNFADVVRAMPGRPGGRDESEAWSRYIQLAASEITARDLFAAIRRFTPELEEITMTIAEQLRQETQQDTLTMLLRQRFGPLPAPYRERLAQQSNDQLEAMLRRVLTAGNLDEVFGQARPR